MTVDHKWFYQREGQTVGPVSPAHIRAMAERGEIEPGTLVRKGRTGQWVKARQLRDLTFPAIDASKRQPPPLPVTPPAISPQVTRSDELPADDLSSQRDKPKAVTPPPVVRVGEPTLMQQLPAGKLLVTAATCAVLMVVGNLIWVAIGASSPRHIASQSNSFDPHQESTPTDLAVKNIDGRSTLAKDAPDANIQAWGHVSGKRWAMVIGVNDYLDAEIPNLQFCNSDANGLANTLVDNCGYSKEHVFLLTTDQPRRLDHPLKINLTQRLSRFLELPEKNDTVIIFFSGHGFVGDDGHARLAPLDCELSNLDHSSLSTKQLKSWLRGCRAQEKLLILDCCHAAADGKGEPRAVTRVSTMSETLSETFSNAAGLITFASCRPSQRSYEWQREKRGLFTHFLIEGLSGAADRDGDRVVYSDEIYRYLSEMVPLTAQRELGAIQEPVEIKGSDVAGVFSLARVAKEKPKPPPKEESLPKIRPQLYVESIPQQELVAGNQLTAKVGVVRPVPAASVIRYTLEGDVPPGVTIHSETGQLLWQTSEKTKAGKYNISVVAFDAAGQAVSARRKVSVQVTQPPKPPSRELIFEELCDDPSNVKLDFNGCIGCGSTSVQNGYLRTHINKGGVGGPKRKQADSSFGELPLNGNYECEIRVRVPHPQKSDWFHFLVGASPGKANENISGDLVDWDFLSDGSTKAKRRIWASDGRGGSINQRTDDLWKINSAHRPGEWLKLKIIVRGESISWSMNDRIVKTEQIALIARDSELESSTLGFSLGYFPAKGKSGAIDLDYVRIYQLNDD